ncbi:MAG: crosslink repair DNA glycosylase YcaQ family protein [Actinomycetota bacterium]
MLIPGAETVLPSLWEAVAGTREVTWGERRASDGRHEFTPSMAKVWQWKDDLPARRLALVGKHFGPRASLVAPRLVPHVVAAAADRRAALTDFHAHVVEMVREHGPCTVPQLRVLCGAEKKHVDALQRALVLTNSHRVPQDAGWDAVAVDLVERLYDVRPVVAADRELARVVAAASGAVSAADVAGALGWRVKRAREALHGFDEHVEDGVTLYSAT